MTGNAPITTPFNAQSTAAEVVAGIDLAGRRVVVTGGASGIGVETARALAGAAAEVTLAVRNLEAGERTAEDIVATTGNKQILVAPLDLADRASVAGAIRTNLQRYVTMEELDRMRARLGGTAANWKTPEQGAPTSVLVAASPLLDGVGGRYFEDCNEAEFNQPGSRRGVAAYALDPEAATLLWQVSVDIPGCSIAVMQ